MKNRRLSSEFFERPASVVARELIGKRLVASDAGSRVSGTIIETEAYLGFDDPADHIYGGRITPRTQVLLSNGGSIYVYHARGIYHCLGIVADKTGVAGSVLIRSLNPEEGVELMQSRRPEGTIYRNLCNGPAKVCQALDLDRKSSGSDLFGNNLFVEVEEFSKEIEICVTSRVGISKRHQEARNWPLRFCVKNHPGLSKSHG